jgi:hypothetical protein
VINKIALPCQKCLIKTRDIRDGVFSLHKILYESKYKKKQGVVFKIDFEKAYNKVCWNFLFFVLTKNVAFFHKKNVALVPLGVVGSNLR